MLSETVVNPFRKPLYRHAFDEAIRSYVANNGGIRRNGAKCGNSMSCEFYRGYDHVMSPNRYSDPKIRYRNSADRDSFGYVFWKAGEAVAFYERAHPVQEVINYAY